MCEREESWQNKFYMLSYTIEKRFLSFFFWGSSPTFDPCGRSSVPPFDWCTNTPTRFLLAALFFPFCPEMHDLQIVYLADISPWYQREFIFCRGKRQQFSTFLDSIFARTASLFIKGWKDCVSIYLHGWTSFSNVMTEICGFAFEGSHVSVVSDI